MEQREEKKSMKVLEKGCNDYQVLLNFYPVLQDWAGLLDVALCNSRKHFRCCGMAADSMQSAHWLLRSGNDPCLSVDLSIAVGEGKTAVGVWTHWDRWIWW